MAPQTKFTKYLYELKPLLEKDDNKSFNLYKVYELFKTKRIDNLFKTLKSKGQSFSNIFYYFLEMNILYFTVNHYSTRKTSCSRSPRSAA